MSKIPKTKRTPPCWWNAFPREYEPHIDDATASQFWVHDALPDFLLISSQISTNR